MSSARGTVHQLPQRTLVGYFSYYGTCDVAMRTIFPTLEEFRAGWLSAVRDRECTCIEPVLATVELHADYGRGITWESEACLRCMTITGKRDDHYEEPKWSDFGYGGRE